MTTFTPDTTNALFQLAADLINRSNRNIFLTGKAGTGKTTFLKYIRENCPKQMAVVAPTGVAAINAGGVTMHSFFQLPLSYFIPEVKGFQQNGQGINRHGLISRLRMNSDKKRLLQELELLIIDEVSMVRCDTLDAVDTVLKHVRQNPREAFGGVQVLFIGDLFQLAPVIKGDEWNILSEYYDSRFFFSSHALREQLPLYVEFDKIYRQKDEKFIQVLNQIRNNQLDDDGIDILKSRYIPSFQPGESEDYIILTTHNSKADTVNNSELGKLPGETVAFKSVVEGDFPENLYPAEQVLTLKVGARVMFIRNDMEKTKRFYNGKIGTITGFKDDAILIQCGKDEKEIEVKKEKWENIRYSVDKSTRAIETDVAGSFTQYPLRLAWAITIHKSQGLTFTKAIIDARNAFEAGQVYVALSRCTDLQGLVLKSMIPKNALSNDRKVVEFSLHNNEPGKLIQELESSSKIYRQNILLQLFDFRLIVALCNEILTYLEENSGSFNEEAIEWIKTPENKLILLQGVAGKFQLQLQQLFESTVSIEKNELLAQRITAAVNHFVAEIDLIIKMIQQSTVVTDSRMHAKEFNDKIRELFSQLSLKKYLLLGCNGNVDINDYHARKKKFVTPSFSVNAYAGSSNRTNEDVPNLLLYQQLRKLRDNLCAEKDLPIYIVAGSSTLNELTTYLPQTLIELRKISGFGDAKIEKYGHQFLDIIQRYCNERNLTSQIHLKVPKRERKEKTTVKKPDTKTESFKLYREGKTIDVIATERNLTSTTIEGHLAYFIESGELSIEDFLSEDVLQKIEPVIVEKGFNSLTPIKEKLGNDITFGQIRMAVAWYKRRNGIV